MRYLASAPKSTSDWLDDLQRSRYIGLSVDYYNSGEAVSLLENRTAQLLDKEAALFFPKGMSAQFAMLKTAEEQHHNRNVIIHPLSHIAWDEKYALQQLFNLNGIYAGTDPQPFGVSDLTHIAQKAAALMVELPLRRAGFRLTPWNELRAISSWCHDHQIHCHMDGARLWESCHYYNRSEADIASLFDTVYVSFYKGLGSCGGAILAGNKDFIEQCRIWRTRLAADQFTAFAQVISSLDGLDNNRAKISELVIRAHEIAGILCDIPNLDVQQPHTNGFFVYPVGNIESLNQRVESLTKERQLKLFEQVSVFPNSHRPMIEMQVGHQHALISNQEIYDYFSALLSTAAC